MTETLLHHLVHTAALRTPQRTALTFGRESADYATLAESVEAFASGLLGLGLSRSDRVGIYLDKRIETVIACFGAAAAGGVFVPLNPISSRSRSDTSCATATCACS
jgi:acyl-CoA synthetase (AMP-forming)/AMP-acid ligase II